MANAILNFHFDYLNPSLTALEDTNRYKIEKYKMQIEKYKIQNREIQIDCFEHLQEGECR